MGLKKIEICLSRYVQKADRNGKIRKPPPGAGDGSAGDGRGHQPMTAAQRAQRPSALAAGS